MMSLLLIGSLTGCAETTQQKSARAKVAADRALAGQQAVQVTHPNPAASVLDVGLVGAGGRSAVAVTVRNDTARPLSDLPVSVGVRTRAGRMIYLNREPGLPYFQTHIGAIAAHGSATWVFTATRDFARGASTPFAAVGFPTVTDQTGVRTLPTITPSLAAKDSPPTGGRISVTVADDSSVPQSGLAVYAVARSGGRLLAAGQTTVSQIDSQTRRTITIMLVGNPGAAAIGLSAPPTNLR